MTQQRFVGVDVSKDWLDVYHPGQGPRRIRTTPATVQAFAADCLRGGDRVVFEATGGYDAPLRAARRAGLRALLPHQSAAGPRFRARHGRHRQDRPGRCPHARRVRGARLQPPPTAPLAAARRALRAQAARRALRAQAARRALRAQATRRRQLVEMQKQEEVTV